MRAGQLLDLGNGTLRVTPWRGHARIAHLTPYARRPFTPALIRNVVEQLSHQGYERALTSALAPGEQEPFLRCGFALEQRLVLLVHDLHEVTRPGPARIRRARRRDREAALVVDHQAFSGFWQLDPTGLDDALSATPANRFRMVEDPDPVAYAISGRAGDTGYIQRLAVAPSHQRGGIGRDLLLDGLGWMMRRGARRAYVNTAEDNASALAFYTALGFDPVPDGLAVLGLSLQADDVAG